MCRIVREPRPSRVQSWPVRLPSEPDAAQYRAARSEAPTELGGRFKHTSVGDITWTVDVRRCLDGSSRRVRPCNSACPPASVTNIPITLTYFVAFSPMHDHQNDTCPANGVFVWCGWVCPAGGQGGLLGPQSPPGCVGVEASRLPRSPGGCSVRSGQDWHPSSPQLTPLRDALELAWSVTEISRGGMVLESIPVSCPRRGSHCSRA